ncbi:MAG: 6-phospho-3-hexuloisomerase [Alphaproteobacteria bacterium]|nr:6-phospho-3-hexuloisomerase [Alphaproteobacteria bacterium]
MKPAAFIDAVFAEQRRAFEALDAAGVEALADDIERARRVFLYGIGRTGLAVQGFAMRLAQCGIEAHFVGQLAAPPAATGDLFISAVALGSLPTADAVAAAARRSGARIAAITARPERVPDADAILRLPAQTMADPPLSVLPLGSPFELALHLLFEHLCLLLMARRGLDAAALGARHANIL